MSYTDYVPYTPAGKLVGGLKLTPMNGLKGLDRCESNRRSRKGVGVLGHVDGDVGQVPVVVMKEQPTTFWGKMKELLPFAVAMFGVSVVSSLTVYWLTRPSREERD